MEQLLQIMKVLREECPWDQAQTPLSLTRFAIEEAYEVEAAVRSGNVEDIRDELGDLLLQVVFQSQMFSEQKAFNFHDVVEAISQKLIRRHPHVFAKESEEPLSKQEVSLLWQQIKQQEKQAKSISFLDDIKHGPALNQAEEIQKKAAKVGFDFENSQDALHKVREELHELEEAIALKQSDKMHEEFGDCLFSLINVGRKLGLSSEMSLLSTIDKFRRRFAFMEQQSLIHHQPLEQMSLLEMDALWMQAKEHFKNQDNHHVGQTEQKKD